ncbi:MAG: FHA domain-containing protein [Lentisphaeraceae bacterium]|nr:FHA domain-containing protein [Lentisphaeraceae bacterium]
MFMTSENLIRSVNAESPQGTEEFLNAYYPYFRILLKHYGCPNQDIDDLCTPVALKLLKALKTFDRQRPGSLRKLINLIVKRTLANHFKKICSKKQMPNTKVTELIPELHEREAQPDWAVKDCQILQSVCSEAVQSYLNRVEPLTYKALKMYVMEYKNAQDISEMLDISTNSVYNHKRNFFLRIVDDAYDTYRKRTSEEVTKTFIAQSLYNYLLDNNPALTIADNPVPDKLLRQVSYLKDKISELPAPQREGYYLLRIDAGSQWQELTDGQTIGSRNADILINDQRVSGPHCSFSIDADGQFTVSDLHSANGTFINGVKIEKQLLIHGDLLQLGSAVGYIYYDNE